MTLRPDADRHRSPASRHYAVIGAGIAGVACARTLLQAGHRVTVFEREAAAGGRMASESTPFGRFDSGAQYFTVRDPRFARVLETTPQICKPWSANLVRVLDAHGRVAEAALPAREPHFVAQPGMDALVAHWAQPLGDALLTGTHVTQIERDALDGRRWQLRTAGADDSQHVYSGFDAVLLAVPPARARALLGDGGLSADLSRRIEPVRIAPCWTLMIAFPQANQPTLSHLGPQWNAARSTHHRVAWLARESSKPGRDPIERWTLQASAAWSQEHLRDDAARVEAKLLRAFAEITGIRAEPSHAQARCWPEAQTQVPVGKPHLWDAKARIGIAGDWCTGHRVEDAFLSGLTLALKLA
ncbi:MULTISPECIES: NAD(P)/FAD-dependent oxidoreductase [Variovorax]|jgi:predicted NAD/FAD-dependent oxidoreductase|uniref:FAD-dependent oxidoreductase n=1 Tax=Variovorax ginsengisoli TaxID=363844 RepID=A0ABT8S4E4_9BURK|nr:MULTISPECIES: FAD-dependent oxidoreductase [Variovorax]MDM0079939.1 FAD-dependent oxidoreductase [Variovorax sp. J31P179]MDN8614601.1 FAD-dependent oxidoreductase [Variovorax ginsengisoli]MDO1533771.1 FAD-dependent oxidoreductase [Variovorax ginsengisoli]HET7835643.1 FAD-dependent oxidoreductase [Variovorax sp.]